MSSSATMQQAKTEATQPAQRQPSNASAVQSEFTDQRPQATAQRQLQNAANNSPQSHQLNSFQQMAKNSSRSMQLKAMSAIMNAPAVQRVEEEEPLQAKSAGETIQRDAADAEAAKAPKPNNTGLPDNLKSGIESLSGMSMDHVKVHYNSAQPAQLNAHAYAQGSEIHVAPGQEQHLPHEAWHVVQQAQGRVQPTMQMKAGVPVNDDVGLESEADVMGARALENGSASDQAMLMQSKTALNLHGSVAQRRTDAPTQAAIEIAANAIVARTEPALITNLNNRITFNANPGLYLPKMLLFPTYRVYAQGLLNDFGNVLAFATANDFTNYHQDDLDGVLNILNDNLNEIDEVRAANTTEMKDARKNDMFAAVAVDRLRGTANGNNANAFGNAATFANATLALNAWEQKYFTLNRASIIQAAKVRADNGAPGKATIWQGLSPAVGGYATHMTIYNANIPAFGPYFVTTATNAAASDGLANQVLANGANTAGIHLTVEINPPPNPNPRLFGNPPNVARNSGYALPGGMTWGNLVAPLVTAQTEVRNDVWALVGQKRADRP